MLTHPNLASRGRHFRHDPHELVFATASAAFEKYENVEDRRGLVSVRPSGLATTQRTASNSSPVSSLFCQAAQHCFLTYSC